MIRTPRKIRAALLASLGAALAVAGAACTGSSGSTPLHVLTSGDYELVAGATPFDACWTDNAVFPPTGIPIRPFALVADDIAGTVSLARPTNLAAIVPVFDGVREINAVFGTGTGSFTVGTNCRLSLYAYFSGAVVADDTIDIDYTSTLTATAITGTSSSCATYAGTIPTNMGVPFPTLDPPQSGSCSFRQTGRLTPYP